MFQDRGREKDKDKERSKDKKSSRRKSRDRSKKNVVEVKKEVVTAEDEERRRELELNEEVDNILEEALGKKEPKPEVKEEQPESASEILKTLKPKYSRMKEESGEESASGETR